MANNYNSNPIYIDTDMTAGWKSLQTLNGGNLPGTIQNPGPIPREFGIRTSKLNLVLAGSQAAGTVLIVDPNDGTILFKQDIPLSGSFNREFDWAVNFPGWHDFKITGPTATGVAVQIWYRN